MRALGAYIFAGGFTLGVKRHFDVEAVLEADDYGVSTMRHNQPEIPVHVGRERWPLDDLPDIDFLYGNPPCFSPDTRVLTEYGPVKIQELVRQRSSVRVWSVDEDGHRALKHIVGWHENPYNGHLYDVRLKNWSRGARYVGSRAQATGNHKFLTRRGWVAVDELTDADEVCTGYAAPNELQRELLDGTLLGDATIKRQQAQLFVSQTCVEYVELKRSAIDSFICQSGCDVPRTLSDNCTRKAMAWFYLKTDGWVKRERLRWYGQDGRKRVPKDVRLTPLSLAVWYMDDGARRARTLTETGHAMFCTDGFVTEDVEMLAERLNNLDIECSVVKKINRRYVEVVGTYSRIVTNSRGSKKLFAMIAAYLPSTMRYKLPSWAASFDAKLWQLGATVTDWDQVVVTRSTRRSTRAHVYCLDVEDTHNFATHGGIAHNCAAWSSAGSSVVQKKDWRVDPRVDCTRTHFGLLEKLRPTVWAWESVTEAFKRGRPFVDELTQRALHLGYSVTYLLHNAMYLGVPQRRHRFMFVAHRVKFDVLEPVWEWQSCDDALRQLNDPGEPLEHNLSRHRELMGKMKYGENLRQAWERFNPEETRSLNSRGQTVGRPPFTIRRARTKEPAPVVMHELVHPTESRGLSIKELAVLCGYPAGYEFIGARDAGQIGRGVCPPVGEWLARNVKRCLERGETDPEPIVQLIDVSTPPGSVTRLPYPGATQMTTSPSPVAETTPPPQAVQSAPQPTNAPAPKPKAGVGSGAYIRTLLMMGFQAERILELVHRHYPGSKASKSDVAWNRGRLRKDGFTPPVGTTQPPATTALAAQSPSTGEAPLVPYPAPTTDAAPPPVHDRQRQNLRTGERESNDPDREFDKTSLRANSHGQWVHRDYGAHFFRWGFAGRFVTNETDVLDVGCGPDCAMVGALTMPRNQVPRSYVGVDLNREPQKHPTRQWAKFRWAFNFLERYEELGQFDLITNFEMIEHVYKPDGERLLAGLHRCLRGDGTLLLSTPVFNGKAAANHLHEWTVPELQESIEAAGFHVERRFGTFASQTDLKKLARPEDLKLMAALADYYSGEVLSCFLAPIYPNASRNNVWLLKKV